MRKRTLVNLLLLALAGTALYALAGFVLAPHLIKRSLVATVAQSAGHSLAIDDIRFNPFTLALTADTLVLTGPSNTPLVSAAHLVGHVSRIHLKDRSLTLDGIVIDRPRIAATDGQWWLSAPNATARDVVVGFASAHYAAGAIRFERPRISVERTPGGEFNVPPWLLRSAPVTSQRRQVDVARIEFDDGQVTLADRVPASPVLLHAYAVHATLERGGSAAGSRVTLAARGRFLPAGTGDVTATWTTGEAPTPDRADINLHDVGIAALSGYLEPATGRTIAGGTLDLTLRLRAGGPVPTSGYDAVVAHLTPGVPTEPGTANAPSLNLDLAMALLEDPDGRMRLQLSVPWRPASAGGGADTGFGLALHRQLMGITRQPFDFVARLAGRPGAPLDRIVFDAGSAAITRAMETRIGTLGGVLRQRPGLSVRVTPAFDPVADHDALAKQQVRLHVNLAASAGMPGQERTTAIDFDDPKIQTILDEFATTRLAGAGEFAAPANPTTRDRAYYEAIFAALATNEPVSDRALKTLARYRARSIVDQFVRAGIELERVRLADVAAITESGHAPVVITLRLTT